MKHAIYSYITATDNPRYIDDLPKIVQNINNSQSTTTGLTPVEAEKANSHYLFHHMYDKYLKRFHISDSDPDPFMEHVHSKNRLQFKNTYQDVKVGDFVRLSNYKNIFDKKYGSTFSCEFFIVKNIINSKPPQFEVTDLQNQKILGNLYRNEITPINLTRDSIFIVDKIIDNFKIGDTTYLKVTWVGFPPSLASYVKKSNLIKF